MPKITAVDRDGQQRSVAADVGISLMDNLRGNGFDEILALCGGCCSCATCHAHVDPPWTDVVGAALDDEQDLLESSDHRTLALAARGADCPGIGCTHLQRKLDPCE